MGREFYIMFQNICVIYTSHIIQNIILFSVSENVHLKLIVIHNGEGNQIRYGGSHPRAIVQVAA